MKSDLVSCDWVFINGETTPSKEASLPADSHALHYGTAAFESLRVHETPNGPCILGFEQHLERLRISLLALGVKGDCTERVRAAVLRTITVNDLREGYLRVLVYPSGDCSRFDPSGYPIDVLVIAWRVKGTRSFPPLKLGVPYLRRPTAGSWLPRAKLSGLYVADVSAHLACRAEGFDDALLLHADGTVCEVTGANVFLVKGKRLQTPLIPHSITGITRKLVVELAASLGSPVEQLPIPLEDFISADEVFVTGTYHGIRAVASIGSISPSFDAPGELTRAMQDRYESLLNNPNSEIGSRWLTPIGTLRERSDKRPQIRYQIRPARLRDAPGILSGIAELLCELRGVPVVQLPPGSESLCNNVIAGVKTGAIFVATPAERDETIIGLLSLSVQEALHLGGPYVLIQELWVHRDYRSAGVGASLVEASEAYGRENKFLTLEVCLPARHFSEFSRTQTFYEARGFIDVGPRMRKEIA